MSDAGVRRSRNGIRCRSVTAVALAVWMVAVACRSGSHLSRTGAGERGVVQRDAATPSTVSAEVSFPDADEIALESARRYAVGNLDGAVRVLQRGVAALPEDAQLHFMLANAYFRRQDWTAAAAEYEEAARLRPRHPDTHLSLGYAHYMAGRVDRAVSAWGKAASQIPNDALAQMSVALGLLRQGRVALARMRMIQAMDLDRQWRQRIAIDMRWTPAMRRAVRSLADQIVAERLDDNGGDGLIEHGVGANPRQ